MSDYKELRIRLSFRLDDAAQMAAYDRLTTGFPSNTARNKFILDCLIAGKTDNASISDDALTPADAAGLDAIKKSLELLTIRLNRLETEKNTSSLFKMPVEKTYQAVKLPPDTPPAAVMPSPEAEPARVPGIKTQTPEPEVIPSPEAEPAVPDDILSYLNSL